MVSSGTTIVGSPPLTRGKEAAIIVLAQITGITPAYAGKSFLPPNPFLLRRDHPRLRGEKFDADILLGRFRGSPPLTRGKVYVSKVFTDTPGITPAYAGKSRKESGINDFSEDHPRLRGEKCASVCWLSFHVGSPPLTRGKALSHGISILSLRITPAYAGKSRCLL